MPFLRLYSGEHLQEQWELTSDRLTIGRANENDVVLASASVSKHHAHIERQGSSFVLVDDNSSNGVFVNNERVTRHTLKYWDEIQIYPYKLVYMALAKLPGEEAGREEGGEGAQDEATVAVGIGNLATEARRQLPPRVAYLVNETSHERYILDKVNFTLGRAKSCDIPCGGFFAPAVAATIQRRSDGWYLIPGKRGQVSVKGAPIEDEARLEDNDSFGVRGLTLKYCFRPLEPR